MPRKNTRAIEPWNVWVVDRPGRAYTLEWIDRAGKRRMRSTGSDDYEVAKAMKAVLAIELATEYVKEPAPPPPSVANATWAEFVAAQEARRFPHLRTKSAQKIRTVLSAFVKHCGQPERIGEIDEASLSKFAAKLKAAPTRLGGPAAAWTIRNYTKALADSLRWAVGEKMLLRAPIAPSIKVPKRSPKLVPDEAVTRLIDSAPDAKWRAFLLSMRWAGLRLGEALALRRKESPGHPWVDFARGMVVIPAAAGKADRDDQVPLHAVLRSALEGLPVEGDRFFVLRGLQGDLTDHGAILALRRLAQRAGVRLTAHDLRRAFCTYFARRVPAPTLQALARHASIATTVAFYANSAAAAVEAMAAAGAEALAGGKVAQV